MSEVSDLLRDSLAAHVQARSLRRQRKFAEANRALREAASKRREATEVDPDMADEAWELPVHGAVYTTPTGAPHTSVKTHREIHADMMMFYREQQALEGGRG